MSKDLIAEMNPGEMLFSDNRVYIGLAKEAYQRLEEFLPAVERYSLDGWISGYRHIVLDYPTNKFIAVYIHENINNKD